MDEQAKIDMAKAMTGETEETLLVIYLAIAKDVILQRAYPFGYAEDAEVPTKYGTLQVEIAVELFNKRGAEGETANSQGGVSRTYQNSYVSERLLARILPCAVSFEV